MFYNPFFKIELLKDQLADLEHRYELVKTDRNWRNNMLAQKDSEIKELKRIINHWQSLAKFTFIAFSLSAMMIIYLLGTI